MKTKMKRNIWIFALALFVAISMGGIIPASAVYAAGDEEQSALTETKETVETDEAEMAETIEAEGADVSKDEEIEQTEEETDADAEETADAKDEDIAESSSDEELAEAAEGTLETTSDEGLTEETEEELDEVTEDTGDFIVKAGTGAEYSFENGILTINSGKVSVSTEGETTQRIVVAGDATLILDGVIISAAGGPAVKIGAGVKATVRLAEGSSNTVTSKGSYAGIEVGYEDGNLATLTIDGSGTLNATGGSNSAGIGGSYTNITPDGKKTSSYCGNIIIKSGTIHANGTSGGAAIGSGDNNGINGDGSTQSKSYKMKSSQIGAITINGGNITAVSTSSGAGIGGGNHCDSGKITINGGNISAKSSDGAGIGCGKGSSNYGGDANKGHGYFYADITINGGTIEEAIAGWLGAGIGGGYECDAIVTINGGIIKKAIGGNGNSGSYYQGAPGIGAGYQGNVIFTMTGGTIEYAEGGWSAPGIGYGAAIQEYGSKRKADGEHVSAADSLISISGGTIKMSKGGIYAAGIGSGNGCSVCNIAISGGNITAVGYSDESTPSAGGAGIGSGVGKASGLKYCADTDVTISITGGTIEATGGWGAAGIGSGANNETAKKITLNDNADIQAFADGTKFAIDTKTTDSNTSITGNVLQGTFVLPYTEDGVSQDTAAVQQVTVINDESGETITLEKPEGYRSFAVAVSSDGAYTVFTDDEHVAEGKGCYYNACATEEYDKDNVKDWNVRYTVTANKLSNNFFLFPVKTIVVSKEVIADDAFKAGIDQTLKFALWQGGSDGAYIEKDGKIWTETIEIAGGVPQNNAYFANVDDGEYGIWEMDENGNEMKVGTSVSEDGSIVLAKIETRHGEDTDNDAVIGTLWAEEITVMNTYEKGKDENPVDPEEPSDEPENPTDGDKTPDGDENPADDPESPAGIEDTEDEPETPAGDTITTKRRGNGTGAVRAVNPANPATALVTGNVGAVDGTTGTDATPEGGVTTITDNDTPLGGLTDDMHKDNILRFLAALATLLVLAVYTKRRKDIKKDIYELEEELAAHEEVQQ